MAERSLLEMKREIRREYLRRGGCGCGGRGVHLKDDPVSWLACMNILACLVIVLERSLLDPGTDTQFRSKL
jgi:hypothetical protein